MVVGVVLVVGAIATAGAAVPAVTAGAIAGVGSGTVGALTGSAVAGAAGMGAAGGAVAGAATAAGAGAATAAAAATGAVTGSVTGAAVTSVGSGSAALGAGIAAAPLGPILLGAEETQEPSEYTFDCWKPVLHDESLEPSRGKLLKDVLLDARVKRVTTATVGDNSMNVAYPPLILENVWGEQFEISPQMVALTGGAVAALATPGLVITNGCLVTGAITGTVTGAVMGLVNAAASAGAATSNSIVYGGSALGGAAGAILGAITAGPGTGMTSVAGAAVASAFGAGTAGATSFAATEGLAMAGIFSGPVGWIVLGATEAAQSPGVYTFDCWKEVLHDQSRQPSHGKLLREVVLDARIKQVKARKDSNSPDVISSLVLQNVWDEEFCLHFVYLPDLDKLAAHAVRI